MDVQIYIYICNRTTMTLRMKHRTISILQLCLIFLISLLPINTFAVELTPIVSNFTKKEYLAANQNWTIAQDSKGYIYSGNNMGLLRYDGIQWELLKLPSGRVVRSIYIDKNDRIYVGSFEEFGYFQQMESGEFIYRSLSEHLKQYKMMNDEIWSIVELNGKVVFQSFTSVFVFDGHNTIGKRFSLLFLLFNRFDRAIYSFVEGRGYSEFNVNQLSFKTLSSTQTITDKIVASVALSNHRILLATAKDGLYLYQNGKTTRFNSDANPILSKAIVNRAILTRDSTIVIGTILDGIVAINTKGQTLWQINSSNFLQNNTVLGLFCDRDNNVWVALDKGISLIQSNTSLRYVSSISPSIGSIYSMTNFFGKSYIGTNHGLYVAQMSTNASARRTTEIDHTPLLKSQVWDISSFDNQLFIGNNDETFVIDKNSSLQQISPVKGGFCIKKGVINGQEVLVQGTYTQLCIYVKNKLGRWVFSHSIQDFLNPVRYLEIDYKGIIWASHLFKGLFRIELTSDLHKIKSRRTYESIDGKSKSNINVFKLHNRVVFTSGNGLYTFDDLNNKIIEFSEVNRGLGAYKNAYRISYFGENKYWFVKNESAGLFEVHNDSINYLNSVQYASFPNESVDASQSVQPLSSSVSVFCLDDAFALFSHTNKPYSKLQPAVLQFKSLKAINSEAEMQEVSIKGNHGSISYDYDNVNITVAYPQFTNPNGILFSFYLEGYDKRWSDPKPINYREYSNLPFGNYTLRVKATTVGGEQIGEILYQLEIRPPFYRTIWAYIIYFILMMIAAYYFSEYLKRELHRKKLKIEHEQIEKHRHELEQSENQIIHLKNEKLESELTMKSKELASSTMSIINKNNILVQIKEELIHQKEQLGNQYPRKYYDKISRIIDENLSSEDDWAIFQSNFDRIHENFFRHLRTNYPELTATDLRFCAYLRLNLATKDIANLMNISVKGVEAGRYRLRKKLSIPSEKSLTDFMIEFK